MLPKSRSPASALFRAPSNVVKDPLDLGAGEVWGQGQAHALLVALHSPVRSQLLDDVLGAGVLPDDGVVDGLAGVLVPHHRGLALVGDAHGGNVVPGQVAAGQGNRDDFPDVVPDFDGIMLDPAGVREDLRVFHLPGGHHGAGMVEDDGPGTGGSLVNGDDACGHGGLPFNGVRGRRGCRRKLRRAAARRWTVPAGHRGPR